ncbi:regulator of chromosome condensation 1/beta-lactamase-inhibitor protein II [Dichotomopilus funicola]|uniref:Regulator of chromosome condensation 1/beta-lactamase-inhibitor protein II n=1 Tax=Dichotomopilus funicola TaxID=1934379 RepID=A0AAN6V627_9PEZI|nr:regulator of chromosome condensation 1/beta-lactamase-inhibitor protein II [Dichotomopilus funicola]
MAPKRAAAEASDNAPAAKRTRTTKATVATVTASDEPKKVAAKKATATKKTAAAPKKAAAATTTKKVAAPKKTPAPKSKQAATPKVAAAPKKKAAAPKKTATAKATKASEESDKENVNAAAAQVTGDKRRRDDDEAADEGQADDIKRAKKEAAPPKPKKVAAPKPKAAPRELKVINHPPTQVMDIFVFGEGTAGELGLGSVRYDGKQPIDVKRPRLNHNLKGVVQVACGGMHVAALTIDNKILTWGVNDQGALGRDTTWDGGLRNVEDEDEDSDDEDDTGMNPKESTPAEIDASGIPENVKWVQLVASDSATFALTTTGQVYGWGTFRSNEGVLGFSRRELVQTIPTIIPELSKIKHLATGLNHVLALDEKNKIYAWGAGQQAQLARRLLERDDTAALYPTGVGALPGRAKAASVACGSYHSFVLDVKGRVIAWGLNNYAELGIEEEAGTDGGFIMRPQLVKNLEPHVITCITGGEHHSLACTAKGELLTWGRIDGNQVGQPSDSFSENNTIWDERNRPRILVVPTVLPDIKDVIHVAAGTDHSFAVTKQGKVYSWGFSANFQTGQGTTDDILVPTLMDNSAIRDRKIVFAGAGGQYGIIGALPLEQ